MENYASSYNLFHKCWLQLKLIVRGGSEIRLETLRRLWLTLHNIKRGKKSYVERMKNVEMMRIDVFLTRKNIEQF